MNNPRVLIDPVMKWGVEPEHKDTINFIDGMTADWPPLPHVGDVLTLPFITDSKTKQLLPVQVTRIVELLDEQPPVVVVVVAPLQRH